MSTDHESRSAYFAAVKSHAQDILETEARGDSSESDRSDAIWEAVDGSEWIIYTNRNIEVIRWTSNDDAFAENGSIGDLVKDGDKAASVYQTIAFYAFLADVTEAVAELEAEQQVPA